MKYQHGIIPPPGIYVDVPEDIYHSWRTAPAVVEGKIVDAPVISGSLLKILRNGSPAHLKHAMSHPVEPTSEMKFGTRYHAAVLEPQKFESAYVVGGPINPKTGKTYGTDTKAFAEWEAQQTRPVMSQSDYDAIIQMRDALMSDPAAAALVKNTKGREVTVIWKHDCGWMCKARIDGFTDYNGWSNHFDLKTAMSAKPSLFINQVASLAYHISAGHYLDGSQRLAPARRRFLFVAQEKEEPYAVGVYELDPAALEKGVADREALIAEWYECWKSNLWPGYTAGQIMPITLPGWALKPGGGLQ